MMLKNNANGIDAATGFGLALEAGTVGREFDRSLAEGADKNFEQVFGDGHIRLREVERAL